MRVHIVAGLCLILSGVYNESKAQQLRLGDNPVSLEKSAVLELTSNRQGLLLPRITDTTLINALSPPDGMIIYHSSSSQLLIRKGGYWHTLTTAGSFSTDQVPEGITNRYYTDARARAALSATSPLAYNSGTGVFSMPAAGSSADGYLNSTDWNIFNSKQAAGNYITGLTGDVTATGPGSVAATIAPNAVTFGKMQAVTANKLLGSGLSGTSIGEITLGTGLSFTGTTLNATGGTLTSLSIASANGFSGTVTNSSTTPAISLSTTISGLLKGSGSALVAATAGTDYQAPISLTTTGASGAATFTSNTLNIPIYTLAGLGGFSNPMTSTGDLIYGGASGVATRLAGNSTIVKQFLSSTGTGAAATAPSWAALASADITTALGFTPYNATNPNGYGTGTVTSVAGTGTVSGLTLTGSVTTSGSLTLGGTLSIAPSNFSSQTANSFLAAPNGAAGAPTFRSIVAADIPTLNQNTTGSAASFTGSLSGDVTGTQSATVVRKINGVSLSGLATGLLKNTTTSGVPSIAVAGTDFQAPITVTTTGSSGAATFSSNTLNIPTYTLTGLGGFANPMTTSGDIIYGGLSGAPTRLAGNITTAKQFLTSTGTGSAANAPAFSALGSADITTALGFTPYNATNPNGYTSNTGTVTSVAGTGTVSGLTLSGTVTTSGNLTLGGTLSVTPSNFASQTANTFLAAPNGAAGAPTFRSIVAADIPTLNQNTTGSAASFTGSLTGDVTGTQSATVVGKINGVALSGLATGLLKNTTATGVPSIAVAGTDFQAPITLTTTGSSGAATFSSNTLNIPTYTLTGLGGFTNPMTATGDLIYGGSSGAATRLAGNTTTSKRFLTSTGTGSAATAPGWNALAASDINTAMGSQSANTVYAAPNGAAGAPSFRTLVSTDLPSTVVYTTDVQTLTNKTISGSSNTLSNIPNSSLTNSTVGLSLTNTAGSVSVSGSPASLGGSMTLNMPFTYFNRSSQVIDLPNIGGNSHLLQTYTVSGAQVGDMVTLNPAADMVASGGPVGIGFAYVSAANTVSVDFFTPTNQSVNLPSITFYFTIMR